MRLMPYFMENESWYTINEKCTNGIYDNDEKEVPFLLTELAPQKAIISYKKYCAELTENSNIFDTGMIIDY